MTTRNLSRQLQTGFGARATDGREAMKLLASDGGDSKPDVSDIDRHMPGQDGMLTIESIRHSQLTTPIIAMTGGGVPHASQPLKVAELPGASTSIAKPFEPKRLATLVGLCISSENSI